MYITPELAANATDILGSLNTKVGIDLIAIDEAHCVSQWGHDFRYSYRKLGQLRSYFPDVSLAEYSLLYLLQKLTFRYKFIYFKKMEPKGGC